MKCPNCNKEIPSEAKFCLHCGTKVEVDASTIDCPSCHARIPKDSKFCPDCGNAIDSLQLKMDQLIAKMNQLKLAELNATGDERRAIQSQQESLEVDMLDIRIQMRNR